MNYVYDDDEGRLKCSFQDKLCYKTKTQARKSRRWYRAKYIAYYSIYLCDKCGFFHLTSVNQRFQQKTKD